MGEKVVQHAAW